MIVPPDSPPSAYCPMIGMAVAPTLCRDNGKKEGKMYSMARIKVKPVPAAKPCFDFLMLRLYHELFNSD